MRLYSLPCDRFRAILKVFVFQPTAFLRSAPHLVEVRSLALLNYMVLASPGAIQKGDIVFYIADHKGDWWKSRDDAHVGLAATDNPRHCNVSSMKVYHVTFEKVILDDWKIHKGFCGVNLSGGVEGLGRSKRAKIIDAALKWYMSKPAMIVRSLYYFGPANREEHPAYPNLQGVYAFTCSSFVDECYQVARKTLLNHAFLPETVESDRLYFASKLAKSGIGSDHVSRDDFKRVKPAYLAHALKNGKYPFESDDWSRCGDHRFFVPLRVLTTEGGSAGEVTAAANADTESSAADSD